MTTSELGETPYTQDSSSTAGTMRQLGLATATFVVIANMIGTGIFTTTGYTILGVPSPTAVLIAWVVGGVLALFGALCFGELSAAINRNGGEYRFLCELYHPSVGFLSGWISLIVGFSAPIAAGALAFGKYSVAMLSISDISNVVASAMSMVIATVLIIVVAALHAIHVQLGSKFQNVFTIGKISLIVVFILAGLFCGTPSLMASNGGKSVMDCIFSGPFAISLIFIGFSYSGWNGAAYLAGEIEQPKRNVPLALVIGTSITAALYVGLNYVFLISAPASELAGKPEVGHVAAVSLFGPSMGQLLSGLIALALVSSVSAMTMVGPRVYEAVGEDHRPLRFLRRDHDGEAPVISILLQAAIAIVMVFTLPFIDLLQLIGFLLSFPIILALLGVYIIRLKEPKKERTLNIPFYVIAAMPAIYILFTIWIIVHLISQNPKILWIGIATLLLGSAVYGFIRWLDKRNEAEESTS